MLTHRKEKNDHLNRHKNHLKKYNIYYLSKQSTIIINQRQELQPDK